LRRDQAGLLGMAWIALFDRDHGKLSRTRLVSTADARDRERQQRRPSRDSSRRLRA
jgi:hypothetical protein